jgi:flagellar hook-basal body complex protein FliE
MSISSISAFGALPIPPIRTSPVGAAASGAAASGAASAAGSVAPAQDFGSVLAQGLDKLQSVQTKSDHLAVQGVTGDLKDIHDYTIAANEATVATELTVAVRNKAVEAFNEIMRMQV